MSRNTITVLVRGRNDLRKYIQKKAEAVVRIKTRDFDIDMGFLMRNDERHQVRVGFCSSTHKRHDLEWYEPRARHVEWQIVAIPRSLIREMVVLQSEAAERAVLHTQINDPAVSQMPKIVAA